VYQPGAQRLKELFEGHGVSIGVPAL